MWGPWDSSGEQNSLKTLSEEGKGELRSFGTWDHRLETKSR